MDLLSLYNYWIYILLMMIGLYAVVAKNNLIKKVIGLGLFQTGIFLFYISMGKVTGAMAPVALSPERVKEFEEAGKAVVYSNPIPHALILTAIVVSVSTMAVALALVVNIKRTYGTIEADEIEAAEEE